MSVEKKAKQLYDDAYMRWCYELSDDKNRLIAKSIATYACDEMINEYSQNSTFAQLEWVEYRITFLKEVKLEIEKL
jgi:hypothetical protein